MLVLQGKLRLHDIEDVEAWTGALIGQHSLNYHDHEDLHAYLIEQAWELAGQYRPGEARFSSWAGSILRKRIHDVDRARFRTRWVFHDRIYERPQPEFVPLDDRPDQPDPAQSVDVDLCGPAALIRLLRERSSGSAWEDGQVGEDTDVLAA